MVIWDWVRQFIHLVYQAIRFWIPLLKPEVEPLEPPVWFEECWEFYSLWSDSLDEEQRPTHTFLKLYWECMWRILMNRLDDRASFLIDKFMHYVVFAVGMLPLPFDTIPEWLVAIRSWIGEILPDWADDIAAGLWRLWNLIPEPIRDGLVTWSEFLAGAPEAIQEWIEEFIADLLATVQEVWDWYVNVGQVVTDWWAWAYLQLEEMVEAPLFWLARNLGEAWAFLIEFWNDPAGAVIGWLSPLLGPLLTFATDCLDFWYNLWGSYAEDLAAFLADPLEFLWDRGESWLNRRLEQS